MKSMAAFCFPASVGEDIRILGIEARGYYRAKFRLCGMILAGTLALAGACFAKPYLEKHDPPIQTAVSGPEDTDSVQSGETDGAGDRRDNKTEAEKTGFYVAAAGLGLTGFCWFGRDYDLHKSRLKRQEIFRRQYYELIVGLSLYVSAGMNLRSAAVKSVEGILERSDCETVVRKVFDGFIRDCRSGISFYDALEWLAELGDCYEYRQLTGWIFRGEKYGTQDMAALLEEEAANAGKNQMRACRIRSEKTGTALILPMMLELLVVIAMIMIPVFTDMELF